VLSLACRLSGDVRFRGMEYTGIPNATEQASDWKTAYRLEGLVGIQTAAIDK